MQITLPASKIFFIVLASGFALINGFILYIVQRRIVKGYDKVIDGQKEIQQHASAGRKALHKKFNKGFRKLGILFNGNKTKIAVLEDRCDRQHPIGGHNGTNKKAS